jgi:hypothetical protein
MANAPESLNVEVAARRNAVAPRRNNMGLVPGLNVNVEKAVNVGAVSPKRSNVALLSGLNSSQSSASNVEAPSEKDVLPNPITAVIKAVTNFFNPKSPNTTGGSRRRRFHRKRGGGGCSQMNEAVLQELPSGYMYPAGQTPCSMNTLLPEVVVTTNGGARKNKNRRSNQKQMARHRPQLRADLDDHRGNACMKPCRDQCGRHT